MRLYELMVIFHPGLEAESVRSAIDRIGAVLGERGGRVGRVDVWGRRRLAYEVRHQKDGTYAVIEVVGEPEAVAELERVLSINDEVLRHKVVRLPESGIPSMVPSVEEEAAPVPAAPVAPAP